MGELGMAINKERPDSVVEKIIEKLQRSLDTQVGPQDMEIHQEGETVQVDEPHVVIGTTGEDEDDVEDTEEEEEGKR